MRVSDTQFSRDARERIYGWDESPDRGTRGEFSDIPVYCLWVSLSQTSGPDDLGPYGRSEKGVRYTISSISFCFSLTSALAITLHPEA